MKLGIYAAKCSTLPISHFELDQTDIPSSFVINYGPTFAIWQYIKSKLTKCYVYEIWTNLLEIVTFIQYNLFYIHSNHYNIMIVL